MPAATTPSLVWVVLTTGGRTKALRLALDSVEPDEVVLIWNGRPATVHDSRTFDVELSTNVGVPAGRDIGARRASAEVIGFLDDDAVATPGIADRIRQQFDDDPRLGAVALRLVDERRETARRHVPRLGGRNPGRSGEVALFLGGACAIRREAYEDAGGYWGELFYGHEELELCWRLIDRGWSIRYLADSTVFHPRTEISRHADGWILTGRNRVMIARRTLPWPIALTHVSAWLVLGLVRAPDRPSRAAYLRGWKAGWRVPIDRSPIAWKTVWRLVRLGRPPVL